MANTIVKAKGTMVGSYGIAHAGDKVTVESKVAKELEKAGLVDVVSDTEADLTIPSKGSVRFADETNAAKQVAKAEAETDPKNPTGQKVAAEKQAPQKQASKKASKKK